MQFEFMCLVAKLHVSRTY